MPAVALAAALVVAGGGLLGSAPQAAASAGPRAVGVRSASLPAAWFTVTRFCLKCEDTPPAGAEVTFLVTPNDAIAGVPWTAYTGTVRFTSSDPKAVLPAPYTFTGSGEGKDQGQHFFTVEFRTSGEQTVTVSSTDPVKMSGISDPIEVVPAKPDHLTFASTPAGATVGKPFSPQPVISVRDEFENLTDATPEIMLNLEVPPDGLGAMITCFEGVHRKAVAGVATFDGCSISRVANGYRIRADAPGVTSGRTDYFIVSFPTAQPPGGIPSPTPSPTPTPAPTATPAPSASPTPEPSGTPGPTATPGPSATPMPSGTPGPTDSPPPGAAVPRITRTPSTITYPATATLSVAFPEGGEGRTLAIEGKVRGAAEWTPVGSVTTDRFGAATLTVKPAHTTSYRAAWAGADGLPAATSGAATVTVRFAITALPAKTKWTVSWGKTLTWTFRLQPRAAGVKVAFRMYEWKDGKWKLRTTKTVTAPASGVITYTRRFVLPGLWAISAVTGHGPANRPGAAPWIFVRVR
jgi:hypothetical protein